MLSQKNKKCSFYLLKNLLILFFLTFYSLTYAQYEAAPSKQWTLSVDIPKRNDTRNHDWALDVIETSDGNFLAVGFSEGVISQNGNSARKLPAWVLLSPQGTLLAEGIIEFGSSVQTGTFEGVVEGDDGYYFGGTKVDQSQNNNKAIIVAKLDKTTLSTVFAKRIHIMDNVSNDVGLSIDVAKNFISGEEEIIIGGSTDSSGTIRALVLKLDKNGTEIEHYSYPSALESKIFGIKAINAVGGYHILFTGMETITATTFDSDDHINSDGTMPPNITVKMHDTDVIVGKLNNALTPFWVNRFNSTSTDSTNPDLNSVFYNYPRVFVDEYGPCTPGKTDGNNTQNCTENIDCCKSPVIDEKFELNSRDVGRKILLSNDGSIIVSCWMNTLYMWEGNQDHRHLQNSSNGPNADPDFMVSGDCGHGYEDYLDAEGYLLRLNASNGALNKAQHTGHLSGGDFNTPIAEDEDGNIYIGGTTADKGFTDPTISPMPDVTAPFANFLVKLDNNLDVVWRHHFLGEGEGNCLFGMTLTSDGGILVCGNTEIVDAGSKYETYSFVKLGPSCIQESITFDVDISTPVHHINTTNNTWTLDRKINSLIKVPYGETLTIDGSGVPGGITIEFAYSKYTRSFDAHIPVGIKVERGGGLVVKNATLKGVNACGGELMWDGIMVEGDPTGDLPVVDQGTINISQDSKVENAVIGVLLDELKYTKQSEIIASVWVAYNNPGNVTGTIVSNDLLDTYNEKGGGRIYARDTEFLNNREGVVFRPVGTHNLSWIKDSDFICNQPMLDDFTYVENGDINGRRLGTRAFVVMDAVKGVQLENCSFLGNLNLDFDLRGTGIESFGSRYTITGPGDSSSGIAFKDLETGIEAQGQNSFFNSILVNGCNFDNVYHGINLRSSLGSQIGNNYFKEIPQPTLFGSGWGIYCYKSAGFLITQNSFENTSPNGVYGLIVSNSSDNGGLIEDNSFDGLRIGNQFEDSNPQLTARCNKYESIQDNSWIVLEDLTGLGALKNQGVLGIGQPKADNLFIDICSGTSSGELNDDIFSNFLFNYYEKTGNSDRPNANCSSTIVNLSTNSDPGEPVCNNPFAPPCPNPPCHTEERTIYDGSLKEVADRNRFMRSFLHWNLYEIPDSVELIEVDSVLNLLASRTGQEDKRMEVTGLIAFGKYTEASTGMASVSGADQETTDFISYNNLLIQAGLAGNHWHNLPQATLDALLAYKSATTSVSENARALDYYYNGSYTPLVPLDVSLYRSQAEKEEEKPRSGSTVTKVYPNPFNQSVSFELVNSEPATITITDLLGRTIWHYKTLKGENTVIWKPNKLEEGTYLYLIETSEGQRQQGKLLYIK